MRYSVLFGGFRMPKQYLIPLPAEQDLPYEAADIAEARGHPTSDLFVSLAGGVRQDA